MSNYRFSRRSLDNLRGVHAELVVLATYTLTISPLDFVVTEGLRSKAKQKRMVDSGASTTMNSRHLTGHAIDIAVLVDGEVRWDWPLYARINEAFAKASSHLGIPYTWGGTWEDLRDGPHYQLTWDNYPKVNYEDKAQYETT